MQEIELWLLHPEERACSAFKHRFSTLPRVKVLQLRYEDAPHHDCFVTAGNAYGIMTAGIDAAVIALLGQEVMDKVQHHIMDAYLGEQPVGSAFVVETGVAERPYLCHAPTMRTPGSIDGSDKVYVATWAALLAIFIHRQQGSSIRTVAMPAMGAGFGGVPFEESARQMAAAYYHFLNVPHRRLDWEWVTDREKRICYDGAQKVCK